MAKPTKAIAIERLQRVWEEIPALKGEKYSSPKFRKWQRNTRIAIANTFGAESAHVKEFEDIRYGVSIGAPILITPTSTIEARIDDRQPFLNGLSRSESILASMIDEVKEYWSDDDEAFTTLEVSQVDAPIDTEKVFIVHGHDHGTRDTMARFLQDLELEPIILQEQPNQGLTIIEKFESYSQVGFAIVLFTPDDIGSAKGDVDSPRYRARQNVIFELGYLIRHLGRSRVAVLYKGNKGEIEILSDYSGVIYTEMDDAGGWKLEIIREMKSAGFSVDANRAFTI